MRVLNVRTKKKSKIHFFRFDSIFSLELLKLLDYQTLWARCHTFKTLTSFQSFKHTWTGRPFKHTLLLIFYNFYFGNAAWFKICHDHYFDCTRMLHTRHISYGTPIKTNSPCQIIFRSLKKWVLFWNLLHSDNRRNVKMFESSQLLKMNKLKVWPW